MPVALIERCERPLHGLPMQSGSDVSIFRHIEVVVEIDERMTFGRVVEHDRRNDQQDAEQDHPPLRRSQYPRGGGLGLNVLFMTHTKRGHSSPKVRDYS